MNGRNLLMIPFAYKSGANTGVNIRRKESSYHIYLKNCCVALISAKQNGDFNTDYAIVTNVQLPSYYSQILSNNGVKIINQDFDCFNFGDNYRWSLAFYKLCALYRIVRSTNYNNYAYLDSDVIILSSFKSLWSKCADQILMYSLSGSSIDDEYSHILQEATPLLKSSLFIHYGGEFFAASRENAMNFSATSLSVFNEMIIKNVATSHGDEFILSLAAQSYTNFIANASEYICRAWTGTYRFIPNNYTSVVALHLPSEKEYGILRLFDKYVARDILLPDKSIIYTICHVHSPSLLTIIKKLIKVFLRIN